MTLGYVKVRLCADVSFLHELIWTPLLITGYAYEKSKNNVSENWVWTAKPDLLSRWARSMLWYIYYLRKNDDC